MGTKKLIDYLTHHEMMMIRVFERTIKYAKTIEEIEEAKTCIGMIMTKIPKRMNNNK